VEEETKDTRDTRAKAERARGEAYTNHTLKKG